MIEINNKYNFGDFVKYRELDWETQSYLYDKGHIIGIEYTDIQQGPSIKYGIIRELKWTNKEEIEEYGVDNDYDYYMKYCTGKDEHLNGCSIEWADENDIINKL